jgi:DNA repair exonuclease SbcCD ATPase subunit
MASQLGDIADRKSPAYYIVMRAQEREVRRIFSPSDFTTSILQQELQRFGDEKELAVKKTEREIRALRSTLERLNSKNQRFKQSFTKVEGESEDLAEMEQLQPVLEAVSDRRRQARTEVEHLSGDVASMQGSLGNLMQETASIDRQVQGLRKRVDSVQVVPSVTNIACSSFSAEFICRRKSASIRARWNAPVRWKRR